MLSLDSGGFGKATTGKGWSCITSVVMVDVILMELSRNVPIVWKERIG